MNPRLTALALASLAVVGTFIYYLGDGTATPPADSATSAKHGQADGSPTARDKDTSAGTAGSAGASKATPAAAQPLNWTRLGALLSGEKAEWMDLAAAADAFLAKHGESPANLIALHTSTSDPKWLERALERFPSSPIVLLAALARSDLPESQRAELIARYKAAEPNNSLPWIFAAETLFKSQQPAAAIAELREALTRPAFYTYSTERIAALRDLYIAAGAQPLEADILSASALPLQHLTAAMAASRGLRDFAAAEGAEPAIVRESAQIMYGLGRTFATPEASRFIIGQLVGVSMEKRALQLAQTDGTEDLLTANPAARLAELESITAEVRALTAESDILIRSQNATLLANYLTRLRAEGEIAALRWLKAQPK